MEIYITCTTIKPSHWECNYHRDTNLWEFPRFIRSRMAR